MKYDAVVIGAGPGGYVCAIRLGQLGLKTAIVEKDQVGGVCLNVGCIPSKALIHAAGTFWKIQNEAEKMGITVSDPKCDLGKMQEWKSGVVKKLTGGVGQLLKANKVDLIRGNAFFKDKSTLGVRSGEGDTQVTASNFVVATGSRNLTLPFLPMNGKNVISSTEALDLKTLPKRLVIIGGGFIGVEIGMAYAKLGSEVHIVEALEQILPSIDKDLVGVVERKMKKMGMTLHTSTFAKGFEETDPASASTLHLKVEKNGKAESLEADVVLVSIGRKPNSEDLGLEKVGVQLDSRGNIKTDNLGRTNVVGIYAIGDVTGPPQLAHRASMDGLLVASTIKGEKAYRDYRTVPWAVFSDPEIAVCGLSEKEATERGIAFKVGRFPFAASGRALSTNETDGFVKVLINEKDESIVGVHMVGPEVSNLIAEAALAVEMGACAEDIVRTIHTHPTLPEAFPEAVEAAYLKAIHTANVPRRSR
ncbi:MAG: dihydrolipoyl dehydrogenase [Bdellovibrionales bacterium]|nr:dihydrolipoyl dehydrogenase [Bdellovibrionales bacterium]